MSQRKTSLALFSLIVMLFISGCSSSPKVKVFNVPQGAQFEVKEFNLDLVQRLNFPGFLDNEQTTELMSLMFKSALEAQGMLAEEGDPNAIPLYVFVDYRRIFIGEESPFPIDEVASPRAFYRIYTKQNDELVSILFSKERTINGFYYIAQFFNQDTHKRDAGFSVSMAIDVAKQLKERIPPYPGYKKLDNTIESSSQLIIEKFNKLSERPQAEMDRSYIPDSVTEPLLGKITSSSFDERMDGYEEIQEQWLNQAELFDTISNSILSRYKNNLSGDDYKEMKEQIKTIALSGLISYENTLEEVAKNGFSQNLRDYAQDNIKELNVRYLQAYQIHLPLPADINLDWERHQLYNMTIAKDLWLNKRSVKRIYRDYPQDEILLDALSEQLNTAIGYGYRPSLYSDYHAWICRVLGLSGNVKYKQQLVRISIEAWSKKVREFADEYADEL